MKLLKALPRPLFILNYYAYLVMAVIIVLLAVALLASDGLSLFDLVVLLGLIAVFGLGWWFLHPQESADLPAAFQTAHESERSYPYTLLAFESEYCPICMTMGRQQLTQLEAKQPDSLKIYRVSVNKDPGQSLFRQFDGRATPTYVLLDADHKVLMEWPLVLPIERILYAVRTA